MIISLLQEKAAQDPDTQAGIHALQSFFERARELNSQTPSWEEFLEGLRQALFPRDQSEKWPGYQGIFYPNHSQEAFLAFVSGLGAQITLGGLSESAMIAAMQSLADQGGGKLPVSQSAFTTVLMNQAAQFDFFEAAWHAAVQTAEDVATGVQKIGDSVIETGQSFLKYKNYLLLAALAIGGFALYKKISATPSEKPHKTPESPVKANPEPSDEKKNPRFSRSTQIQTLLFPLKHFPAKKDVRTWAKKHGFKSASVEKGSKYWRLRQETPSRFDKRTFRTIDLQKNKHGKGIKAVVGVPRS